MFTKDEDLTDLLEFIRGEGLSSGPGIRTARYPQDESQLGLQRAVLRLEEEGLVYRRHTARWFIYWMPTEQE